MEPFKLTIKRQQQETIVSIGSVQLAYLHECDALEMLIS
jgi:hypothetical protein